MCNVESLLCCISVRQIMNLGNRLIGNNESRIQFYLWVCCLLTFWGAFCSPLFGRKMGMLAWRWEYHIVEVSHV